MRANWGLILLPPFLIAALMLIGPQYVFLQTSFHKDIGVGRFGDALVFDNYVDAFRDPFYFRSLLTDFWVSINALVIAVACAYPVAYILARMRSRWAGVILSVVVVSSLISVTIKVLGLIIIFGADGPLNRAAIDLGLVSERIKFIGTESGVVIGLVHYVLGFLILTFFAVIRTIPRSQEEAARIHGASGVRVFWRVILPLSLPGVINGSLIVFNLCMGAFVSAAILGGGKVLTLPVIIERTVILESQYGLGGALSGILLVIVFAINMIAAVLVAHSSAMRFRPR